MRSKSQRVDDVIIHTYRSQLKKFLSLAVYDDYGNFLYGMETEFGTKVTEQLIEITRKRLAKLELDRMNKKRFNIENIQNGQAK